MNMGQLRKLVRLSTLPDDAPVLVHQTSLVLRPAVAQLTPIVQSPDGFIMDREAFGDEEVIDALIIK